MRRTFVVFGALMGLTACVAAIALAQSEAAHEQSTSWGADITASSAYMWRGMTDIPEPSLQPSVWLSIGPLTIDSWFSGPDPDSGLRLREHDLTVEYEHEAGPVNLTAGWTHYFLRYNPVDRHAHEVFVRLSSEAAITPTIEIAHTLESGGGTTVIPSVESRIPVSPRLQAIGLLAVGYNHHQWIEQSLFTHVEGRAALEWRAHDGLTMRPFVGWSRSLNRSVLPSRAFAGLELSLQGRL